MMPGKRSGAPRGGGAPGSQAVTTPAGTADSTPPQRQPREATLEEALAERDRGAEAAVNAAHTFWRLAAEQAIRDLAREGRPFTAEDLRARVGQLGGHHNAMGGLFIAAAKRGEIRPAGFRRAARKEAHGRILQAWVGAS